ncbi:MAG: hypothetical protein ACRYGG_06705 [Janthinobacterium lividum]
MSAGILSDRLQMVLALALECDTLILLVMDVLTTSGLARMALSMPTKMARLEME